jgi:hypothetical protein
MSCKGFNIIDYIKGDNTSQPINCFSSLISNEYFQAASYEYDYINALYSGKLYLLDRAKT